MFSYRGASSCEACPQEGVECAGGVVTLEPGYWRQDSGQPVGAHSLFLPCPNTASCVVNTEWSSNLVGPQHGTATHQLPPHNETGTLPYAHSHTLRFCNRLEHHHRCSSSWSGSSQLDCALCCWLPRVGLHSEHAPTQCARPTDVAHTSRRLAAVCTDHCAQRVIKDSPRLAVVSAPNAGTAVLPGQ